MKSDKVKVEDYIGWVMLMAIFIVPILYFSLSSGNQKSASEIESSRSRGAEFDNTLAYCNEIMSRQIINMEDNQVQYCAQFLGDLRRGN